MPKKCVGVELIAIFKKHRRHKVPRILAYPILRRLGRKSAGRCSPVTPEGSIEAETPGLKIAINGMYTTLFDTI